MTFIDDNRSERKRQSDAQNLSKRHSKPRTIRAKLFKGIGRVWHFALRPYGDPKTRVDIATTIDPNFPSFYEQTYNQPATKAKLFYPTSNGDKWIDGDGLDKIREACRQIAYREIGKGIYPRSEGDIQALLLEVQSIAKGLPPRKPREGCIHVVSLNRIPGVIKVGYTAVTNPEERVKAYERIFGGIQRQTRIKILGVGNAAVAEHEFHSRFKTFAAPYEYPADTECYLLTPERARELILQLCMELGFNCETWSWS